jgi:nucleotide-binding universal stress UspA family protein
MIMDKLVVLPEARDYIIENGGAVTIRMVKGQGACCSMLSPTFELRRVYSLFINKLAGRVKEAVLVHVVDKGHTEEVVEKQKNEALDRLTALRQNLEDADVKTEICVRVGMPARQIAKIAEEDDVSLVMMATRGAGSSRKLFVGSTAENVIRDSARSVLLFPVSSRK